MLRSDHLVEHFNSLSTSQRGRWRFEPSRFICHLTVIPSDLNCLQNLTYKLATKFNILRLLEMTGVKYFSAPPNVLLKCANYGAIAGFMKTKYINISCSSCLWIQAYIPTLLRLNNPINSYH